MKNNKGFTLIELLLTIVLLSVISIISFVSINAIINKNKENECNSLVNNIKMAAKEYTSDNRYKNNFNTTINTKYLIDNNYLSSNITNPYTKDELTTEELEDIVISIILNVDKTPKNIIITDETEEGVIRKCILQD